MGGNHTLYGYFIQPFTDPFFLLAVCLTVLLVGAYFIYEPYRQSQTNPPALSYRHFYADPESINPETKQNTLAPFPSIFDEATKYLSLIVPAYNEENRLQEMMQETMSYLLERQKYDSTFTFEIIIVNDGSTDRTSQVAMEYVKSYKADTVRLLDLDQNEGKGGAVQQGMLHARGKYLLMLDADGATDIRDLEKVEKGLLAIVKDGHGVSVGSRAHLQRTAVAKRKWYRNILMYGFHFAVRVIGGVSQIKDTQCGFKLFTRKSAQVLFSTLHIRRWCFDVELLYIAESLGIPLAEVSVRWREVDGSKINVLESSVLMGRDLVTVRMCYVTGLWQVNHNGASEHNAFRAKHAANEHSAGTDEKKIAASDDVDADDGDYDIDAMLDAKNKQPQSASKRSSRRRSRRAD